MNKKLTEIKEKFEKLPCVESVEISKILWLKLKVHTHRGYTYVLGHHVTDVESLYREVIECESGHSFYKKDNLK